MASLVKLDNYYIDINSVMWLKDLPSEKVEVAFVDGSKITFKGDACEIAKIIYGFNQESQVDFVEYKYKALLQNE